MINVDRYELCVTFALNVPTRDVFMFFFQKRKSHTAMMNFEDISAIDNSYTFDFEEFLMQQYNLNNNLICKLFQTGNCQNKDCKNSHTLHPVNPFEKTIVCKHWLRGVKNLIF